MNTSILTVIAAYKAAAAAGDLAHLRELRVRLFWCVNAVDETLIEAVFRLREAGAGPAPYHRAVVLGRFDHEGKAQAALHALREHLKSNS